MTGNIGKDPIEWNPHIRTKDAYEAIKQRFREPNDPLQMVIVRDMWLTGFDAPCVHTMYIDKVMQGHNLMQAIARVNRVFRDKPAGVIVDYIGIGDKLRNATKKYTSGGGKGKPTIDLDEAMGYCREQVALAKMYMPEAVDYSQWNGLTKGDKLLIVQKCVNHIVKSDQSAENFMVEEKKLSGLVSIAKTHPDMREIAVDVVVLQHVAMAVRKVKNPTMYKKGTQEQVKGLIRRSIDSDDIIDVYGMCGLEKPDISILDEKFLLGAKEQKDTADIRVEMLRQILNNEIKVRMPKNKVKFESLKKQVEELIKRYHDNAVDSYTAILKMFEHAKEMQEEDKRKSELGLSDEELAFYDILFLHKDAIKDYDLIANIAKEVTKEVERNLKLDWYRHVGLKSAVRLAVKHALRGKVKITDLDAILAEIMDQAEGQYHEWPVRA